MCRISSSEGVGLTRSFFFMCERYYEVFRTVNDTLRRWHESKMRGAGKRLLPSSTPLRSHPKGRDLRLIECVPVRSRELTRITCMFGQLTRSTTMFIRPSTAIVLVGACSLSSFAAIAQPADPFTSTYTES